MRIQAAMIVCLLGSGAFAGANEMPFTCEFREFSSSDELKIEAVELEIEFDLDLERQQASISGEGFAETASLYRGPTAFSLVQPIFATGAVQTLTVYSDGSAVYVRSSSLSVGGGFSMTWLGNCEVPEEFW